MPDSRNGRIWGRFAAQREQAPSPQVMGARKRRYNGKCRLNNARNAAGFTGLAR
jgi:hypothetical protein